MLSKNDNDRAHTHTGQTEQERPNGGRKEKKGGEREAGVGRVAENESGQIESLRHDTMETIITDAKYGFIEGALKETLKPAPLVENKLNKSRRIDKIVTSKLFSTCPLHPTCSQPLHLHRTPSPRSTPYRCRAPPVRGRPPGCNGNSSNRRDTRALT